MTFLLVHRATQYRCKDCSMRQHLLRFRNTRVTMVTTKEKTSIQFGSNIALETEVWGVVFSEAPPSRGRTLSGIVAFVWGCSTAWMKVVLYLIFLLSFLTLKDLFEWDTLSGSSTFFLSLFLRKLDRGVRSLSASYVCICFLRVSRITVTRAGIVANFTGFLVS